jgi:hypothetical protein
MFVRHGLLEDMQDLWTMIARYPRSELPAEQLLVTLELKGDTNRLNEILPSLCSKFPSSSIPKNRYLALKSRSDRAAEDFLILHMQRFPRESSLVELVENGTDQPNSWRWGTWDKVFSTMDPEHKDGNQILANRLRDSCRRRGEIWDLILVWEALEGRWERDEFKDFALVQQTWCHIELENWAKVRLLLRRPTSWRVFDSDKWKEFGKHLGRKGHWGFVVDEIEHSYRLTGMLLCLLRGAMAGLKEKGDIDGLIRLTMGLNSSARMREGLQAMLDVLNSGSHGRVSVGDSSR